MLQCIAVDDEPLALSLLTDYIRKVPFLELVAACEDAFEAGRVLQQQQVDLVFMDIQMPGLTGLQFIQSMVKRPMIVLVTAYKKFAPQGFDLDVVDYLVKPVGLDRFLKACNKAQDLHQLRTSNKTVQADYIFFNIDHGMVKVDFGDINWIEMAGDYVKIHLSSAARPLLVRMTGKALDTELPADKFIRIHKSYIVPISGITAIHKSSLFISDLELPIGETFREAVRQLTRREL